AGLFAALDLDYSFDGETVTRAEFISSVMGLMNLAPAGTFEAIFKDVTPDTPYNSAVYMAAKLGFISEGEYFEPSRPITYAEACKIMVTALGYSAPAYTKGGYPYGFMQQASQLDLGLGLEMKEDSNFTIYDFSLFLSNAIDIDACVVTGSTVDKKGESYRVYRESGSILEIYRELYRVEGVLSGNGVSFLYDEAVGVSRDRIMIGNETYIYETYENLGMNVNAFYKLGKDGIKEIVYLQPEENSSVTFTEEDGFEIRGEYGYYYDEKGKERKVKIDSKIATLYNGVADKSMDLANISFTDGYVELIDNDDDGDYDVISVKEYSYMIINKIDLVNGYIYSSNAEQLIDLSDERTLYTLAQYGDIENIPDGACIEYTVAKDGVDEEGNVKYGRYYDIKVCSKKISGVIDSVVTDAESTKFVINGQKYEMTNHFYNKYMNIAQLGVEVEVYLTGDDKLIAVASYSDKGFPYGFFYGAAKVGSLFGGYQVRIFSQDGSHYIFDLAEKFKLNNEKMNDEDAFDVLKDMNEQIIRYSLNGDGQVKAINTAAPIVDGDTNIYFFDKEDEDNNIVKQFKPANTATTYYRSTNGSFAGEYIIGSATKVFCIDEDETDLTKAFKMASYSSMVSGKSPNIPAGKLTAYNVGIDGGIAGAVVFKTSNINIENGYKQYGVVVSVEDSIDNEGTNAKVIQLYKNDQFSYYFLNNADYTEELGAGDLVLYSVGNNGYLSVINRIYDCSENATGGNMFLAKPLATSDGFIKGKLLYIGDTSVMIQSGTTIHSIPYSIAKHAFVSRRGHVYTQSKSALIGERQSGQELEVILRVDDGMSQYLFVYEN
ncbi:MAG: S-layer homology domain-containing protein, partial [Bacteroidaceae bacterium]|nr:S-layer homology domain-containing protein [Bacteroidaceae bacterium]